MVLAPNKVDENFGEPGFEHVFLANGVSPVNADGFALFDVASTTEVLDFYKKIAKASPSMNCFGSSHAKCISLVRPL